MEQQSTEFGSLVVIGASAGGIDALSQLLGALAPSFPAPIVVAQHAIPARGARVGEILRQRTRLPVVTVSDRQALKPGTVLLVPPDHHVVISDRTVEARPAGGDQSSPSIDGLLSTAADAFGERLIAVILSGLAPDGVIGAGRVKARGGTVLVQDPETASQPASPDALRPALADFVADPDHMGELLTELTTIAPITSEDEDDERLLAQFLDQLRERTGIDFSAYKRSTVLRRLQRRMVATGNARLDDYARYVQARPDESQRLASAFLIKVTQFFRDADLFEHLRSTLLPRLVQEAMGRDRALRLWSAGCATGEEAYSLAMLAADLLGDGLDTFSVRIFATDLDEDAISVARRGIYPASAMSAVRPDLLKRWFVSNQDQYEVAKSIRSMVVFGRHDLGQRAPFPRIDLTMCRNVLIYFTPELQRRALQLFAFSLREGGYLVLGKAESAAQLAEHFSMVQPNLKVYRRLANRVLIPQARILGAVAAMPGLPPAVRPGRQQPGIERAGERGVREDGRPGGEPWDDILVRLPVGVVLIDRAHDISFINSEARRLLGIHGAAIGSDLLHVANRLPPDELRAAIGEAISGTKRAVTSTLEVQGHEGVDSAHVQLTFQPHGGGSEGGAASSVLITAVDVSEAVASRRALEQELGRARSEERGLAGRLEGLGRSNRGLVEANADLANANTVLRIANEELLVANEEVQAASEEVETLNEELQATNEELETLNEELQATVEELNATNDDLESRSTELVETAATLADQRHRSEIERQRLSLILDGMTEAVMVVDQQGEVIGTNRAYDAEFGSEQLVPQDAAGGELPRGEWPQTRAALGETFTMSFTRPEAGVGARRWYEANGRASRNAGGAVIVIRDITDRSLRHLQERFIDAASHELQTPLAALHNYLQLALRRTEEDDADEARRYLQRGIEQSRLLGNLASRLFDVSLIRHGRMVVRREPVSLRAVLLGAVEDVRSATPGAEVVVRPGRTRALVTGDGLRLRQMLVNLLRNAVTHGASEQPVEASLEVGHDAVTIRIVDHGRGLSASVRSHLFSPFIATGGGSGLGLGVYLAHAIATEHGGSLELKPGKGGGTEARVELALAEPRAAGGPRRARRAT